LDRGDRIGYKDTIVVGIGETRENVVSFGGDVVVDGAVEKTVFVFGGSITISGRVGEAVVGIGSEIRLKATADIQGDLVVLGGMVTKEPGSRIGGDTVSFKVGQLTGKAFGQGLAGFLSVSFWPLIIILKAANAFVWLLMAIVITALFPRQIIFASGQVRRRFWPIFWTGLLGLVIFTVFVVLAAILCLVLIGIPILLTLILAGLAVKIFGRIVLFYLVGESLARAFNRKSVSPAGGALLGLSALILIGFVPFLGFLVSTVLGILGWGLALRTKFGTMENWFQRAARPSYPVPPPPPAPPTA
ncbi:MAG: hypothetical protein PHI34_14740, partial [Acidobacteriota bacterium]|nr:hypothetical protein [Acidobacteriota bacterium]